MKGNLSDDDLLKLSEFISARMGLNFTPARWGDLERHANSAAKEFGFADAAAFLPWLLTSPLTREQIEILASHLTISESYFWREPQVLEALKNDILPGLIRSRAAGERRLRIWSAGCSTGEEPYTIAILLSMLIPDLKKWNITILATDINPHILHKAAAGLYREWSFRNSPAGLKENYFTAASQGKFQISPEIRSMVTFAYLNLAEDNYPSPINNTNAMDLIFCRNVLMYFSKERILQSGQCFYQALVEDGWLVVGSSELSQQLFPQFTSIHFPGAIVYRRAGEKTRAAAPLSARSAAASQPPEPVLKAVVKAAPRTPPAPAQAQILTPPPDAVENERLEAQQMGKVQKVRTLANQGRLDEAWLACEQAIGSDKLNLGLRFLGASILLEQDRLAEARAALKSALYLDPHFVLAHFALGNLALKQANSAEAEKHFKNALAILNGCNPDDILPQAEGLTAGRLGEIIQATLDIGAPTP